MKTRSIILMLVSLLSCKKDEEISVSANKNIAGEMAGHYEYFQQLIDKETHIHWDIYKLSDSTIALKSVYSIRVYPSRPVSRIDSIPYIKLTQANKIDFTHQITNSNEPRWPAGYTIFKANGDLKLNELAVKLTYTYTEYGTEIEIAKLRKK